MLLDKKYEVVGLDTDLYERSTFGEGIVEIPELKKDVRDITLEDLEGFEAVFHLAGLSNDPLGNLNPKLTEEINYLASVKLAELAKKVIRQTGGTYDKERSQEENKLIKLLKNLLQLRPPVRSAFRKVSSNPTLKNNRQKWQLFGVIIYLNYIKNLEKIRLLLGGKSRT